LGYSENAEDIKIAEAEIKLLEKKFENRKYVLLESLQFELALLENDAEKRKAILEKDLRDIQVMTKRKKKPTAKQIAQLQQAANDNIDAIHKLVDAIDKRLFPGIANRFYGVKENEHREKINQH
jgi:hypothetical protein